MPVPCCSNGLERQITATHGHAFIGSELPECRSGETLRRSPKQLFAEVESLSVLCLVPAVEVDSERKVEGSSDGGPALVSGLSGWCRLFPVVSGPRAELVLTPSTAGHADCPGHSAREAMLAGPGGLSPLPTLIGEGSP
jgi:hypothetical protein